MLKINWSKRAQKEFNDTIIYWIERNKSDSYSKKLIKEVEKKQDFLLINPHSGTPVNYKSVFKIQVLKHFSLIFDLKDDEIKILSFWDNRRNPDNLEI